MINELLDKMLDNKHYSSEKQKFASEIKENVEILINEIRELKQKQTSDNHSSS